LLSEIFTVQRIMPYTNIATATIEGRTKKKPPNLRFSFFFSLIDFIKTPNQNMPSIKGASLAI
jgi:hypothetical protein